MERLIFVCPATDQEVDVGITSDLMSLLRMRGEHVRAQCPACGKQHEWLVGDAYLAKAVESANPGASSGRSRESGEPSRP